MSQISENKTRMLTDNIIPNTQARITIITRVIVFVGKMK